MLVQWRLFSLFEETPRAVHIYAYIVYTERETHLYKASGRRRTMSVSKYVAHITSYILRKHNGADLQTNFVYSRNAEFPTHCYATQCLAAEDVINDW